jgi:hypothetical protein
MSVELQQSFRENQFNIQRLMAEIVTASATSQPSQN